MKTLYKKLRTILGTIPTDKLLHFIVCASIVVFVYQIVNIMLAAIAVSMAVGVIKELLDSKEDGNYYDWNDIIADVSGTIFGFLLMIPQMIMNL